MLKKSLSTLVLGLVIYLGIIVLFLLVLYALSWYGVVAPWRLIMYTTSEQLSSVVVMCISLTPASIFVGYRLRRWGWLLAMFLEPSRVPLGFLFSPFIQRAAAALSGTEMPIGGYIDWRWLILYQLLPGLTLGWIGGVTGELIRIWRERKLEAIGELEQDYDDNDYPPLANIKDLLRWYFGRSLRIIYRLPVLVIFGGFAIVTLVMNAPTLIGSVLGAQYWDSASKTSIPIGPMAWVLPVFQAAYIVSPAVILPWLWSSANLLPRSTRTGLTVGVFPIWFVVFLLLGRLGLM